MFFQVICLRAHNLTFLVNFIFREQFFYWLFLKIADLVTLTEEILNGKLHFLCDVGPYKTSLFAKSSITDI